MAKHKEPSKSDTIVSAESCLFTRIVSCVTLLAYCTVTLSPAAQATESMPAPPPALPTVVQPLADPHADNLDRLRSRLQSLTQQHVDKQSLQEEKRELRQLAAELTALQAQELAQLEADEQEIKARKLPESILERHRETVARFKAQAEQTQAELAEIDGAAENSPALGETATTLRTRLERTQTKRRHQRLDPSSLPFRTPAKQTRQPKTAADEFAAMFAEPVAGVKLASLHPASVFIAAQASGTVPGPEHLAATVDVQLTPAISELAQQLNNNPVEIYQWVRNNVQYVPTQGSIQGSAMTLEMRQGNAFDIASLLIALLRAAGIPARYAYGTIEVPIAQVMNWVGGMTSPNAALDHLAQGGVPVLGLAQGGVIRAARMEHVWVEAFVDFVPSRGARNRTPDTWVPMDASFKQYRAIPALITPELTAELQAVANQYLQAAQGSDGALTGFDTAALEQPLAAFQEQVAALVGGTSEKFMLEEFVGGREIIATSAPVLSASLPYRVVARGPTWAALPESQRVIARVELLNAGLHGDDGAQLFAASLPLPTLGYGSLHLTHVPATPDDAATWDSYTSAGATEFPAYLIRARSRLTLNGNLLAESGSIGLGEDLVLRVSFQGPFGGPVRSAQFSIVAGDEVQIGVNGGGLTPDQGLELRNRTGLDSAEGNLYVANKVFWTQADFQQRLLAQLSNAAVARLPSVGIFAAPISIVYSFGIPRRASYHSRQVDVKLAQMSASSLDGDAEKTRRLVMHTGMTLSSIEGAVIEQVFGKRIGHGSNTMRLLELANSNNVPIFHITAANLASVRPRLQHSPDVMADINNAVSAGLEVVIPQFTQTNGTWTGSGYIMMDPHTGSADYRVSGGLSGNFDDEACGRQTQPVRVTVPDISFIWWLLFGYLVDEDYNFNGVGLATVVVEVILVGALLAIVAPVAGAALVAGARAVAPLARATFTAVAAAFSGLAFAEVEDDCSCQPQPMNRRKGGTSPFTLRHNACADRYTDFPGVDVELRDIAFDGWIVAEDKLYEIKTGTFYSVIWALAGNRPSARRFLDVLLGKAIYDFYRERVPSGLCGIEFGFGVSDPVLMLDMQNFFINDAGNPLDAARVFPNGC
ncbi:transglutaminase-like domain-containing protein [Steroidobacter gossypii]|nr:transglutaminase-like domain-containing protein [Steroidobacter gossypii]